MQKKISDTAVCQQIKYIACCALELRFFLEVDVKCRLDCSYSINFVVEPVVFKKFVSLQVAQKTAEKSTVENESVQNTENTANATEQTEQMELSEENKPSSEQAQS